jgi:hypothetical protein
MQFELIFCVALNGAMFMNDESESVLLGAMLAHFNAQSLTFLETPRKTTISESGYVVSWLRIRIILL